MQLGESDIPLKIYLIHLVFAFSNEWTNEGIATVMTLTAILNTLI